MFQDQNRETINKYLKSCCVLQDHYDDERDKNVFHNTIPDLRDQDQDHSVQDQDRYFWSQTGLVLDRRSQTTSLVLSVGVLARHQVAISAKKTVKVCNVNNYWYNSTFVGRFFSRGAIIMRPHRSKMSDTLLEMLMFLHCNISIYWNKKLQLHNFVREHQIMAADPADIW